MYNLPNLDDAWLIRKVPRVMGTQHPDNVSRVPFGTSARVDRVQEEDEVFYNTLILGLGELMIDYERKQGGATPLWDWLHRCPECLQEKIIGEDFRVTPRIPNPDTDRDDPYFWQALGVFVNSPLVMHRMGLEGPAFTEFIIPDTHRGETLARIEADIAARFALEKDQYRRYGDGEHFPYKEELFVQGIPLIEAVEELLDPTPIWEALIATRKELTGRETWVQRSFIARSDPALKAGMIPAILAARMALAHGVAFEQRTGVKVPQILGIGSAPFRGGLAPTPDAIEAVTNSYPAMATVTVQSAFRYDHLEAQVINAIKTLDHAISTGWLGRASTVGIPGLGGGPDARRLRTLVTKLKVRYEESYRDILPVLVRVAEKVPSHRDRYGRVEVVGQDRTVGGLPAVRAIKFAASCYSLGVPPGLLGLSCWNGLDEEERALARAVSPTLNHWLAEERKWLDPAAPAWFHKHGMREVAADMEAALELNQIEPMPAHGEVTGRIRAALDGEREFSEEILEAARVRRFLG